MIKVNEKVSIVFLGKEIVKNLKIQAKLSDGKEYLIEEFEKIDDSTFGFCVENYLSGKLIFKTELDVVTVDLEMKIANRASFPHNRFEDETVSVVMNIEKDTAFLAHHNYNNWWTRPVFCENEEDIPQNTQTLAWKNGKNTFTLQTLCYQEFKSVIEGKADGCHVNAVANTSGYSQINTKLFVISWDKNPYKAYEIAVKTALKELNTTSCDIKKRRYPDMFNYLGFCTWNAFYSDVYADGVLEKADEFVDKNLPVKWFLIDHGWSQAEDDCLVSFEEDFEKFPGGLAHLKKQLEKRGVKNLGVWQGFGGHWGTVKSGSQVYKEMREVLLRTNTGGLIPYPSREKSFVFWNEWHRYLKKQGVDFVKVDIQSSLSILTQGNMSIGKASKEAHIGLEASVGVNFDGAVINCMGMSTEQFLNRPISGISRNSDDFFPKRENSFKEHVMQNAYNTLYHGNIYYGDWDMWWTNHPDALNNSYLRALSGGPLYVSDRVSETDAEKIMPHILDDGFVLKCDEQGIIAKEQIFKDPSTLGEAVKVYNIKGKTGYIGAFNCTMNNTPVKAKIKSKDISSLIETEQYLVYDYANKKAQVVEKGQVLDYTLEANKSILLSYTPIIDGHAFLGSVDKFISSAVISEEMGNVCMLKYGGEVLFYCEDLKEVKINSKPVEVKSEGNIHTVTAPKEKMVIEFSK